MSKKVYCVLMCFMFIACKPQAESSAEQSSAESVRQETSAEKNLRLNHGVRNIPPERMLRSQVTPHYRVSYQPVTDPIPLNAHFRLTVNLQELKTSRAPQSPVLISAEADMPEHNHGMQVTPEVVPLGQGQYEVKGLLFHMAGYWELKLSLQPESGAEETAIFGIQVDVKPTPDDPHNH